MNGDAAREKLAAALVDSDWWSVDTEDDRVQLRLVLGDLLPAVREIAAEELREAADAYQRGLRKDAPTVPMSLVEVAPWLRDLADALDPQ